MKQIGIKKVFLCSVVSLALAFAFSMTSAEATIFLSGDSNIMTPLVTTNYAGLPIDPGNQQFFESILNGGTNVLVLQGDVAAVNGTDINNFYNGLGGVTSNLISGPVTAADLSGVNLFFAPMPADAFTASEITDLGNFLAGGSSVFFLGEWSGYSSENSRINSALLALGSGLSIVPLTVFDTGFHTATGSQIATDPFTAGVSTFTYAAPSQVSGGTDLFFATTGQPFVAYEGAAPVPEPSTILLLGAGLAGVGLMRRRFKEIICTDDDYR